MARVEITEADTGFGPEPGDRSRFTIETAEIASLNLSGRGRPDAEGTVRVMLRSGREVTIRCTTTARAEAVYNRLLGAG